MVSIRHLAFGAACAALSFMAEAQQIIVTATRIPQPISDVLRDATVISAEDIARAGPISLAELLQQLGGLEIASAGGRGGATSVFIRGANAAHTLVLVDGVRLQSATVGATAFENIPLAQIERIEIVPGPASSLYGSDAIGGVIQIFTRGGRGGSGAQASATLGSHDTGALEAAASASWDATDVSLSGGVLRSGGINATRPGISFGRFNADRDSYRNANLSGRLVHRYGDGQELGASVFLSDGAARYDNGPDNDPRTEQKLSVVSAYLRNRLGAWESLVRLGASRDDSASLGDAFPGEFRTDQAQASWQNTFTVGAGAALVAGAEYVEQKVATDSPFAVTRRNIASVFAGANLERAGHALQASARRDDNSQFGTPTTGSVAYGYRITPALRVRAAYGTAFHAPSFNDLYFPGFGNPQLAPERSRNREAGIDYQWGTQRLAATYFDNRIAGLIVFVFDPATFEGRPENVARARVRGTEISWSGQLAATQLRAKLALQDPQSLPDGYQLQRRAKRHGSLVATRAFGAWSAGAEVVASGERFDSANESPSSRMAGYGFLNLTLARALTPEWSVDVRWNNVADKDYELVQGFRTSGSNAMVTLRWNARRL